jgi:hypothetical protein
MRKRNIYVGAALFLLVAFITMAYAGPTWNNRERLKSAPMHINYRTGDTPWAIRVTGTNDARRFEARHDGSLVVFDSSTTRLFVDGSGNMTIYDSSGTVDRYEPSDKVIYITSKTQLSTWTGAASGSSYYQTEPGKIHIIDPTAINSTGMGAGTFSGVTLVLPDAGTYSGPAYDVEIQWLSLSGETSGSTTIIVHPYPGSGTTYYGRGLGNKPQTLHTIYGLYGEIRTNTIASGLSYWEVDRPGESVVFRLYNGGTSATPIKRNILN